MKPTLLILAAGMGSRYGGLKQIDQIGPSGETIIDYSIYDAIKAGFGKVVFVIRRNIEQEFKEVVGDKFTGKIEVDYAIQEVDVEIDGIDNLPERVKPWGTGHAVLVAEHNIDTPFAVINADDFYGADAFRVMASFLQDLGDTNGNEFSMVGYILQNTLSDHGSVSRGVCGADENGFLKTITERTDINRQDGEISYSEQDVKVKLAPDTIVSMNFWGFTPSIFEVLRTQFKEFVAQNYENPKSEFFIPLVVNHLIEKDQATVKVLTSEAKWYGITYREDKEIVGKAFDNFVKQGEYPTPLW
ncbi:sugar phosphate nucleotidyltransferase [Fulvivirgaceae bacterium BMA10]|uniref:Sugar phosphate nucleotidyltransferase n=1 Tax=Splendidivirga corallicola TaxID=3051826 RepID=A0ABT8KVY2_9BACT|nr:sugar phosphate nucleotidyltransferase [Fulvivirgaceae bacterium BMA10]